MMRLRAILISVVALALAGGLAVLWLAPGKGEPQRLPDITFTTLQGEALGTPQLRGRPVLVNFWATSCRSCTREMPHLIELYQELSPRGLEVIGVAMAYDPPNRVVAFSEARQIPFPIALDLNGAAARAFGDVHFTPSTFLIAPDGRIVHQASGALDLPRIRDLLLDMLAQQFAANGPLPES